jgi:lysylphosphatidylglycerol synthetase-like protein (DUF2156 family)
MRTLDQSSAIFLVVQWISHVRPTDFEWIDVNQAPLEPVVDVSRPQLRGLVDGFIAGHGTLGLCTIAGM